MKLLACLLALAFVFLSSAMSHAPIQTAKSPVKVRSAVSSEIEDIKDF